MNSTVSLAALSFHFPIPTHSYKWFIQSTFKAVGYFDERLLFPRQWKVYFPPRFRRKTSAPGTQGLRIAPRKEVVYRCLIQSISQVGTSIPAAESYSHRGNPAFKAELALIGPKANIRAVPLHDRKNSSLNKAGHSKITHRFPIEKGDKK